ncbi:MAG TPA: GNAT family N-acetyltransferase [Novosphingobium sp.]
MTAAFRIATATPADAAEIAAIYAHHVLHGTATFETEPPDAAEIAARMEKVAASGGPWLTARDPDGLLLGYGYAGRFHAREAYRFACEDSIYLHHDRLGQGIGTVLLKSLIEAAEAAGFRQMIALIAGTEPASTALHARAGFSDAGRLAAVGWKHGRWIDVLYMQRALGPGETRPGT